VPLVSVIVPPAVVERKIGPDVGGTTPILSMVDVLLLNLAGSPPAIYK
jgi:hypothetical protein